MQINVPVSDLLPGDYLPQTKRTVLFVEQGARTPRGYTEVGLRRDASRCHPGITNVSGSVWRSGTLITVIRTEG